MPAHVLTLRTCAHARRMQVCRQEFCWVCLGDWQAHSAATGGFYACNRPANDDAAEGAAAGPAGAATEQGGSSGSSTRQPPQQQQQGVRGGLLDSVFSAFRAAVLMHKQRHYLRLHATFEVERPRLQQLLRYQQLLLAVLLQQPDPQAAAGGAPGGSTDSPSHQQQQCQVAAQAADTKLVQQLLLQWHC